MGKVKIGRLVFGDALFGFVKARKGEKVFDALRRQGREVRKARQEMFENSTRRFK